jgi:bla regulator protein BlaR1
MESLLTELSRLFGWLLGSTFQASVLVCIILLLKALVRERIVVRWHYWLWLVLVVRMVMPWAPESSFSVFTVISKARKAIVSEHMAKVPALPCPPGAAGQGQGGERAGPGKAIEGASEGAGTVVFSHWAKMIPMLWLAGVFVLGGSAMASNLRLWRIVKSERPLTEGGILDLLEDCKAEMGIKAMVGVVVTDRIGSPALLGVVRPRLLLPEGTIQGLSREELRYVFLHELGHLKRCDIYLGWLMVVLQVMHWFNPLVWFAFRWMRADRESACDGVVLSTIRGDEPERYGRTIVKLFTGYSRMHYLPGIAGILESKSRLKMRIMMIARFKKRPHRSSIAALVLIMLLALVGLTNAKQPALVTGTRENVLKAIGRPVLYERRGKVLDGTDDYTEASSVHLAGLQSIDLSSEHEQRAYEALEELVQSGSYGNLQGSDIAEALGRIEAAQRQGEQAKDELAGSTKELESALRALGIDQKKPEK